MKNTSLKQFVTLRRQLTEERDQIAARLQEINEALGDLPQPVSATPTTPTVEQPARRGRGAAGGGQSLRDHVLAVLQSGPQTKEEVLSAVQSRGYKFSTSNPLNSLGVILYGKNPKFNRVDGKFSLSGSSTGAGSTGGGRRTMSPAARARIAAAQKARWANQRGGQSNTPKVSTNGTSAKPQRKMSAAGRKAIAEAARKRWAAAKAAGKSRL